MLHIECHAVARGQHNDFSKLFVQYQAAVRQSRVVSACTSVHAGIVRLMVKDRRTLRWVAAEDDRPSPEGSSVAIDTRARKRLAQATVDTGQKLTPDHAELIEDEEPRPLQVCLEGMKPFRSLDGRPVARVPPMNEAMDRTCAEAQLKRR